MRIDKLSELMKNSGLDALILSRESNIYYYAGTISGGFLVIIHDAEPVLLASPTNLAIAKDQASGCKVKPYSNANLATQIEELLAPLKAKKLGYDDMPLEFSSKLHEKLPAIELRSSSNLIWSMRRVKDTDEQKLMRRAGELADIGMEAVKECLSVGIREHEVAAKAAYAMMQNGAEDLAFSSIIASGPRSAYPHAGVTERRLEKGDLVVIDMGATYKQYRSDITRTFIIGEPTPKQTEIYQAVLEANEKALPRIASGASAREVDGVARDIIRNVGYGENFVHSLGHGVGLEVHEPPSLSEVSGDALEYGNVVSDEPGVYLPGFGGVRIEDTVLISDSGPKRLTHFPKDLNSMSI